MTKLIVAGLAAACLIAGCAHDKATLLPVPAPGAATIPDVTAFLAPADHRASDPMTSRRFDWGGYQASDAFQTDDGRAFVTTWSYPPFGPFVAANGDGGEVYLTDGTTVRIAATQDGGKPYLQGFYGAGCGGTGWVIFRNDAPTGQWASLVARLSGGEIPGACAADVPAFTRYRLEQVTVPFLIDGQRQDITLPTIVSEHFNNVSIDKATALERSFFAAGYGRLIWEAWTTGPATGVNLADRCPGTAFSTPPAPGWTLSDCRTSTNVQPADGSLTGDGFGWPPQGVTLP